MKREEQEGREELAWGGGREAAGSSVAPRPEPACPGPALEADVPGASVCICRHLVVFWRNAPPWANADLRTKSHPQVVLLDREVHSPPLGALSFFVVVVVRDLLWSLFSRPVHLKGNGKN